MVMMLKELLPLKLSDMEYNLKVQRFPWDRCLEQCRPPECHRPLLDLDYRMVITAMCHHLCRQDLNPHRLHLWRRLPVACPNARRPLKLGMEVLRRAICLQVSAMALNSINKGLQLGSHLRQDLDPQQVLKLLLQHSRMV